MKKARAQRRDYSMMSYVRAQVKNPRNQYPAWTEEQEAYLRRHWGTMSAKEIAVTLGRPYSGVLMHAHRLGLKAKGSASFSERMRQVAIVREQRIANDPHAKQQRSQHMRDSAIARRAREAKQP